MMPPDSSSDFDDHLERSLRDLQHLRDDMKHEVFMVYSPQDIPQIGEIKIHPRRVYEDLENAGTRV